MPKQGLAIIFPCNLQIWTVGSSSLEGKCLTGFLVFKLLLIKIASFSAECWNWDTVTVFKKKKFALSKHNGWFLFKGALIISSHFPEAATKLPLLFLLLLPLLILLSCLLSGGHPQSNTTVSGSMGMQSAEEPKVAHLCSVLLRPNTHQPD